MKIYFRSKIFQTMAHTMLFAGGSVAAAEAGKPILEIWAGLPAPHYPRFWQFN